MRKCELEENKNNVLINLHVQWKLLLVYENVDPHVDALIKQQLSASVAWWGDNDNFMRRRGPRRGVRVRHLGRNRDTRRVKNARLYRTAYWNRRLLPYGEKSGKKKGGRGATWDQI